MRAATKPLLRTRAVASMWYLRGKKFRYNIATYVHQLVTEFTPVQQHFLFHYMAPCV